ncbi:MAG: tRNA threonylcarbamoyladenosine dehydratase, partial [Clostridia bacterium]|nr:tRNA threonylcarbamoyladenosine dehydratase [Clostridia bacterium]
MRERFARTERLIGEGSLLKLNNSRVAVFGIGGVGGYVAEALARSGVGALDLIDGDEVALSNINRQIIALSSTVGKNKADVMADRIAEINPDAKVKAYNLYYTEETQGEFDFSSYDYIVDAIDMVKSKILLAVNAEKCGAKIISAMGAGNKLDPTAFKVADIYQTKVCPLAKVMRKELKSRGISRLKVVYSEEEPIKVGEAEEGSVKRQTPGSIAFVPSVVGLIIAGEVVKDLI